MKAINRVIANGESDTIEFKSSFNANVIETAVAMANTRGGLIFLGVDDKGNTAGAEFGDEALRDIVNRISTATEPSIIPQVERIDDDHGAVIVLHIPEYPLAITRNSVVDILLHNHEVTDWESVNGYPLLSY